VTYPCGIIFPAFSPSDPKDDRGCCLDAGHSGPHKFKSMSGALVEWETDMECNCEMCQQDDSHDWCVTYWFVNDKGTTND
jgi:hypothetical protein